MTGLGPLEPLLADPTVTEVMLNGPGHAYVERARAARAGRRWRSMPPPSCGWWNESSRRSVSVSIAPSPMVDARLPDGSRLHAVIPPLAVDGPCVTIRRFGTRAVPLEAFEAGPAASRFLRWAVLAGWNLLVAGGHERGQDHAAQRALDGDSRTASASSRSRRPPSSGSRSHTWCGSRHDPPNAEGAGGVTVRQLVRAALRMRPDRLVVGEVRGGEALDMLQALNTGHDGSMSTVHANGTADALARLETLVLLADAGLPLPPCAAQVAASVDVVVFVARRAGGTARDRGDRRGRRGR